MSAQEATYLSPDGRKIATYHHAQGAKDGEEWPLDMIDVDCVFAGGSTEACTHTIANTDYKFPLIWSRDSKMVAVAVGTLILSYPSSTPDGVLAKETRFEAAEAGAGPKVFEAEYLRKKGGTYQARPKNIGRWLVNGRGQIVGAEWVVAEGRPLVVKDNWAHEVSFPPGGMNPAEPGVELRISVDRLGFFVWFAKLADRGLLMEFGQNSARTIPIPAALHGPARILWDASTSRPLAAFDPFGLYPLAGVDDAAWLARAIEAMRQAEPGTALNTASLATDSKTALVGLETRPGCFEKRLVRPDGVRTLTTKCQPWATVGPASTVTPVTITGGTLDLKGQLYSRPSGENGLRRGLIINFHGGPEIDTMVDGIAEVDRTLGERFDILTVDYRGSTGYGESYFYSLHQPVADVALADLNTVVAWARKQPQFKGRKIGFWGTSWGGLAGYAALSRPAPPDVDFIIAQSGLIEASPMQRTMRCAQEVRSGSENALLFGSTTDSHGRCVLNGTGLLERRISNSIPILMLNGETDFQTTIDIARDWLAGVAKTKACVSFVVSKAGGHGLGSWPEQSAEKAREVARKWVSDVEAKRPARCNTQLSLP